MLERDFSDAGRMMTSSRSTTDAKYVEMILFLHGNLDLIPENIPELDGTQSHLPGRLDNPNPELEGLSGTFSPVDLPGNKQEAAATARFASLGLFKQGGGASEGPSLEESARAELKTLRAIAAGTLTAELSCEGVLMWWKRWGSSYQLLARVARVVF